MQEYFQRQAYLAELAELAQLSEYHFCRMFQQSMAQTPQTYLLAIRIEQVKLRICTAWKVSLILLYSVALLIKVIYGVI